MSFYDLFSSLAVADDKETAFIIACQLNADQAIRRVTKRGDEFPAFAPEDVLRVARALADHGGLGDLQPPRGSHGVRPEAQRKDYAQTSSEAISAALGLTEGAK